METWKVSKTFFPVLKFNIRLMNFLGSQQYLRNIFNRKKLSFCQNKFYSAVFILRFFIKLQRQNATNVTVTYVTNLPEESF